MAMMDIVRIPPGLAMGRRHRTSAQTLQEKRFLHHTHTLPVEEKNFECEEKLPWNDPSEDCQPVFCLSRVWLRLRARRSELLLNGVDQKRLDNLHWLVSLLVSIQWFMIITPEQNRQPEDMELPHWSTSISKATGYVHLSMLGHWIFCLDHLSPSKLECWRPWYLDPFLKKPHDYIALPSCFPATLWWSCCHSSRCRQGDTS